jgi:hypothetical protein
MTKKELYHWETSILVPVKLISIVAKHLEEKQKTIEDNYRKKHIGKFKILVSCIQVRTRSIVVTVDSENEISVNLVSDAIGDCIPNEYDKVKIPYWS